MTQYFDAPQPPRKSDVRKAAGKSGKKPKPLKERIPQLPPLAVNPDDISTPDTRAAAVVNLRMLGTPWPDVVKELGYASVQSAQTAYYSALAGLHPKENFEVLQQVEALRAENLLGQAMRMASADFLVDDKGNRIANTDKLRWHDQALKALQLHARITGAQAPARMEVTADTAELNAMVQVLMQQHAGEITQEASIWDVEDVEDAEVVEGDDVA
jgi:hypothetical protein